MAVTTYGYAVGNLLPMPPRPPGWSKRTPAQRRRTQIARWRNYRKLTQQKFADELDTTKATISRIENRIIPYSQDFLEAAADILNTTPSALISEPPPEPRPARKKKP